MMYVNEPVSSLNFKKLHRVRILNAFHFAGVTTVYNLTHLQAGDLLKMRNFGRRMLDSVRIALREEGFSLWGEEQRDKRCGTCWHAKPSASKNARLIDCHCPIPFFAAEFPGNLEPDGGRDCPAWK
jgi:hypothetical protein